MRAFAYHVSVVSCTAMIVITVLLAVHVITFKENGTYYDDTPYEASYDYK